MWNLKCQFELNANLNLSSVGTVTSLKDYNWPPIMCIHSRKPRCMVGDFDFSFGSLRPPVAVVFIGVLDRSPQPYDPTDHIQNAGG